MKEKQQRLINVRLVGLFMLYWPMPEAVQTVAHEVSLRQEGEVDVIGKMYYDRLLRSFKADRGSIPCPSVLVSSPSFDTKANLMKEVLVAASQDYHNAQRRALVRDGFRCVVTGRYDTSLGEKTKELHNEIMASGKGTGTIQCAHILPEITNALVAAPDTEHGKGYVGSVWAMDAPHGVDIHHLENVVTMCYDVRQKFAKLNLWFIETDISNKYELHASHDYFISGYPQTVTFKNHSDHNFPLPSPTYLKVHAACARIARLSGATAQINEILMDMEDIQVLAEDGTSADLLGHAITALDPRLPFPS
ncbi:hypothetical protein BDN72DRAFT_892975 [Pluteus cervinus]|uniref:Uncharacterized protein n=1 Tax=Pluteus cervinus TaxID=181527 RepID=A0ACD3B9V8_9AGAR|nr:hypothetical protein BDN72DRAFT_892975 [Pluteus cervinus]